MLRQLLFMRAQDALGIRVSLSGKMKSGNFRNFSGVAGKGDVWFLGRVDRLAEIVSFKRKEVELLLGRCAKLRAAALQRNEFKGFRSALDRGEGRLGVIAEVKKASPSAGVIDPDFDPLRQAGRYAEGGASALSVPTDREFFQGDLSCLARIAERVEAPCLRKDFIVHEAQVYEAVVAGADAVLLIVAALGEDELRRLFEEARAVQLDVLVEVHDLGEMERALDLGADLVGVNNRDLKTFTTDLGVTERLAEEAPEEVLLVSESGIGSVADARRVLEAGADAVLIGEALMRAEDPAAEVAAYLEVDLGSGDGK